MTSRLHEVRINALFGLYNHVIDLRIDERITAIIGPNGCGKTVCLKIIEALYRKNYNYFISIPFSTIEFSFTEGQKIEICSEPIEVGSEDSPDLWRGQHALYFCITSPNHDTLTWRPPTLLPRSEEVRELSRHAPELQLIGPDRWRDRRDGELLTLAEILARYRGRIPPKLLSRLRHGGEPEELTNITKGVECHLIETQRLLILSSEEPDADYEFEARWGRRPQPTAPLAVQQKALKLRQIIKDTMTEYATLSQSLDRSFPRRVLQSQSSARITQEELGKELDRLDNRRKALMAAGILDTEFEPVNISVGYIEAGVARVLEIYVQDTDKKLTVFDRLLDRLDLLTDLINRRFSDKRLTVDKEKGFGLVSRTGQEIPLEKLSSGEQHQLVLTFELLFEVQEDSLILIDEPELSLHVTWQKSFIDSLKRMIRLNKFDVVLATHSPPLVARHYGLTVELGPVDDEGE